LDEIREAVDIVVGNLIPVEAYEKLEGRKDIEKKAIIFNHFKTFLNR
jgi:hypothetical protein